MSMQVEERRLLWQGWLGAQSWGLLPDMSQEKPGHICNHPEFKRLIYSQSVVKAGLLRMPVGLCCKQSSGATLFSFFPSLFLSFLHVFLHLLFTSSFPLSPLVVSVSPVCRLLTHAGEHISLLHSSALTSGCWLNFEALRRLPLSSSSSWVVYRWPQHRVTPRLQGIGGSRGGQGVKALLRILLFICGA